MTAATKQNPPLPYGNGGFSNIHALQFVCHLGERFALLVGRRIGRITHRHYGNGTNAFAETESLGTLLNVEIADPAGAETAVCSRKADMFRSYGGIDIGMVMPVATAFPRLRAVGTYDYI